MISWRDEWADWVKRQMEIESEEIERLLTEAIRRQRFDMIDVLIVVRQDGCAPGVASMVPRCTS